MGRLSPELVSVRCDLPPVSSQARPMHNDNRETFVGTFRVECLGSSLSSWTRRITSCLPQMARLGSRSRGWFAVCLFARQCLAPFSRVNPAALGQLALSRAAVNPV